MIETSHNDITVFRFSRRCFGCLPCRRFDFVIVGSGRLLESLHVIVGSGRLLESLHVIVGSGRLLESLHVIVGSGRLLESLHVIVGSGRLLESLHVKGPAEEQGLTEI